MDYLLIYALLALTTGIVACYELLRPVIWERENIHNNLIKDKFIHYFSFLLISILIAPLIILPCLNPSLGERFKAVLSRELFTDK